MPTKYPGELTYSEAIRQAHVQLMDRDERVLVYGLGVDDPKAMYGTLSDFPEIYGADRCFDTPLSEDSLTGYGIGLAISGFKPIHVHQRTDFLLLCLNQLVNMAAKVKYLSNGAHTCPFTVRAITGRSWGQGSQHSQSLHSLLSNIPGLRVLVPSTPQDAFNTYLNLYKQHIPTVIIEHRMLYKTSSFIRVQDSVPDITQISAGDSLTFCSISHMSLEVQRAASALKSRDIHCDHFSLVALSQPNLHPLFKSAQKTGKLLIVDHGWLTSSIAHTISSTLTAMGYKGCIKILGYAESPCPTARSLESYFYPSADQIYKICCDMLALDVLPSLTFGISREVLSFKGPF